MLEQDVASNNSADGVHDDISEAADGGIHSRGRKKKSKTDTCKQLHDAKAEV